MNPTIHAATMPKLVANTAANSQVIYNDFGGGSLPAHHFKFQCLEITDGIVNPGGIDPTTYRFTGKWGSAISIRYIGNGNQNDGTASLSGGVLSLTISSVPADNVTLTLSSYATWADLANAITANGKYIVGYVQDGSAPSTMTGFDSGGSVVSSASIFAGYAYGRASSFTYHVGDMFFYGPLSAYVVKVQHTFNIATTPDVDTTDYGVLLSQSLIAGIGTTGRGPGGSLTYDDVINMRDFTFDRVFIHPHEITGSNPYPTVPQTIYRDGGPVTVQSAPPYTFSAIGLSMNGTRLTLRDSWVSGFGGSIIGNSNGGGVAAFGSDIGQTVRLINNELGATFNSVALGFGGSNHFNPNNQATISSATSATFTSGSGSATFSTVNALQVGDLTAMPIDRATWTNLTVSGNSVTDASSTGLFNSRMIGGGIAFGANPARLDWWFITAVTDSNNLTTGNRVLDNAVTNPPAGTGKTGFVGCVNQSVNAPCFAVVQIDSISGTNVTYHAASGGLMPGGPAGGAFGPLRMTPVPSGTAQWRGTILYDVVVQRNRFFRPMAWTSDGYYGTGAPAQKYGGIELKSCSLCTIDGNIFDGPFSSMGIVENTGTGINECCPWSGFFDYTISNNLFLTQTSSLTMSCYYDVMIVTTCKNVIFTNNLTVMTRGTLVGSLPFKLFIGGIQGAWTFTHNTWLSRGNNLVTQSCCTDELGNPGVALFQGFNIAAPSFTFKDNIVDLGTSGIFNGYYLGCTTDTCRANGTFPPSGVISNGNVAVYSDFAQGGLGDCVGLTNAQCAVSAPYGLPNDGTHGGSAATWAGVGLLDFVLCHGSTDAALPSPNPSGILTGYTIDYTKCALASNSAFKGKATDGTDPGVNFATLDAALGSRRPVAASRPAAADRPLAPNRPVAPSRPSDGYN